VPFDQKTFDLQKVVTMNLFALPSGIKGAEEFSALSHVVKMKGGAYWN
jgi:hypothetical protein